MQNFGIFKITDYNFEVKIVILNMTDQYSILVTYLSVELVLVVKSGIK